MAQAAILSGESGDINMANTHATTVEHDDSSISSTGTELFDREPKMPRTDDGAWRVDADGNWQRYPSAESATSTGLSSINSSAVADNSPQPQQSNNSPSRKRYSDGTIKEPAKLHSSSSLSSLSQPISSEVSTQSAEGKPAKVPKRRGRPPKDPNAAPKTTSPRSRKVSAAYQVPQEVRPRSSIPSRLPAEIYALQCIEAAHASRLDPYALHPGENNLLFDLITHPEVTVYLNIRNAILRLWTRNPLSSVTTEEAAGCAKDSRFFGLAEVARTWLMRNGYINFGCIDVPQEAPASIRAKKNLPQKTVVVIGAGVAGLTTSRQLESLFAHNERQWAEQGQRPPRVIILEGRNRIGGRVFSKPLRSQTNGSLPGGLRNTAEMGAMIVTGFDHGNPLDIIIRGQLGLRYHMMRDSLTIYDCDGEAVDEERDTLNTELYTDISDRTGEYRAIAAVQDTLKGDKELIDRCRDPAVNGFAGFALQPLEPEFDPLDVTKKSILKRGRRRNAPPGTEKLTGRSQVIEPSNATEKAARAAKKMGWELKDEVPKSSTLHLDGIAHSSKTPSLGSVMDEAIKQYQEIVDLTPYDMRLLNWHHANLEYANAAPVSSLSLSGHDQDTGNEFEGAHAEVVGGYTQVPRGLMNLPTRLDVRFDKIVDSIHYIEDSEDEEQVSTRVVCQDGDTIDADEVIITAPLGVLKSDTVDFDPPLPSWKQGALDRMGFGLLNKVILLYDEPFWDDDRDMFGLLNEAERKASLDPADYAKRRGRFYLIWNCTKISGRPMLCALMAGNAAFEAEKTDTTTLLSEVTDRLRGIFSQTTVPQPREVIVTRWKQDPFSRGTYSYVGPKTQPGDYDLMAKPVGNLHFAGEATCGTHPATVHGAFLSGLRVASEVAEAMMGPIELPTPLVGAPVIKPEQVARMPTYQSPSSRTRFAATAANPNSTNSSTNSSSLSSLATTTTSTTSSAPAVTIKLEPGTTAPTAPTVRKSSSSATPKPTFTTTTQPPSKSVVASDSSFWASSRFDASALDHEAALLGTILSLLGDKPVKPDRPGVNPFLLYTKEKWAACKEYCDANPGSAPHHGKGSGSSAVRATIGTWWRALSEEAKKPYMEASVQAQEAASTARKEYETNIVNWEAEAEKLRRQYVEANPDAGSEVGKMALGGQGAGMGVSKRKTNVSNSSALDFL